jgi:hypothetical protein
MQASCAFVSPSMAYVLLCALRRIGLFHAERQSWSRGNILKLLKIGALVRTSCRRIKILSVRLSGCAAVWVMRPLVSSYQRRRMRPRIAA